MKQYRVTLKRVEYEIARVAADSEEAARQRALRIGPREYGMLHFALMDNRCEVLGVVAEPPDPAHAGRLGDEACPEAAEGPTQAAAGEPVTVRWRCPRCAELHQGTRGALHFCIFCNYKTVAQDTQPVMPRCCPAEDLRPKLQALTPGTWRNGLVTGLWYGCCATTLSLSLAAFFWLLAAGPRGGAIPLPPPAGASAKEVPASRP